jgi:hypothetical protein
VDSRKLLQPWKPFGCEAEFLEANPLPESEPNGALITFVYTWRLFLQSCLQITLLVKLVNYRRASLLVACDPCRCTPVAGDLHTSDYIGFTDKIRHQHPSSSSSFPSTPAPPNHKAFMHP